MDNDLNKTDAPTQRILIIAETISRFGPITLAQLTERLQFSRGAIWRAVATMRAQGWVRMRMGDNAFEMRSRFVDLLTQGHHGAPEADLLETLLDQVAQTGPVYVDLGQFTQVGLCKIVESSRKALPSDPLSLCDDDLAVAAQLSMTPKDLVMHLRSYIVTARDEERRVITSGEHGRYLTRLRGAGAVWHDDRITVAFAVAGHSGIAIRAELWRTTKTDIARFDSQMSQIIAENRAKAAIQTQ